MGDALVPRLSAQEWTALTASIEGRLLGAQLQKLRAPSRDRLALRLRSPGESIFLCLCADPRAPRIGATESQPSTLPAAPALLSWARSVLRGRRLLAIDWAPLKGRGERAVSCRLSFSNGSLLLEIDGARSELYGLDHEGRICAWARGLPERGLRLGGLWAPPEIFAESDPTSPVNFEAVASSAEFTAPTIDLFSLEERCERTLAALESVQRERNLRSIFRRARRRLTRRKQAIEGDLARATNARSLQRQGELLKGSLHLIKRGMSEVTVTDWFEPELPARTLSLDPRLDGAENLAKIFKQARRALRGTEEAGRRLEETELQLLQLEELEEELLSETSEHTLSTDALLEQLWQEGLYRPPPQRQGKRRAPRLPYQLFHSASGARILVGRGGRDNHQTTFQVARGRDLWLHVRDAAGAHVIVPVDGGASPTQETLLDAAALAVHHSKLRGEPGALVMCCERKYVRPLSGAAPGQVSVSAKGSLPATELLARIERLYSDRPREH